MKQELNSNNITWIREKGFAGPEQLRVRQVMENQTGVEEPGMAFDDTKELEP